MLSYRAQSSDSRDRQALLLLQKHWTRISELTLLRKCYCHVKIVAIVENGNKWQWQNKVMLPPQILFFQWYLRLYELISAVAVAATSLFRRKGMYEKGDAFQISRSLSSNLFEFMSEEN